MTEFITRNHKGNWFEVAIKTDDKQHYHAAQNFARSLIGHEKPCEIIHCKDCKNASPSVTSVKNAVWCREFRAYMCVDDFCSYGKRKCENG